MTLQRALVIVTLWFAAPAWSANAATQASPPTDAGSVADILETFATSKRKLLDVDLPPRNPIELQFQLMSSANVLFVMGAELIVPDVGLAIDRSGRAGGVLSWPLAFALWTAVGTDLQVVFEPQLDLRNSRGRGLVAFGLQRRDLPGLIGANTGFSVELGGFAARDRQGGVLGVAVSLYARPGIDFCSIRYRALISRGAVEQQVFLDLLSFTLNTPASEP